MEAALHDVQTAGHEMVKIGYNFIHNSSSIQHRAQAVDAGRKLLYVSHFALFIFMFFQSMAYLLIIADQVDVSCLLSAIDEAEEALRALASSSNTLEIDERYTFLRAKVEEVSETVR